MDKKEHPYWKGYYASKNGSVFRKRVKYLKPILHHTGYTKVTLRKDGAMKQVSIHRFIWEVFNGDIDNKFIINHKDGDKTNNALSNLELVTNSENALHAFKLGLRKSKCGADSHYAKLTKLDATNLILSIIAGEKDKTLSERYKLHRNYISLIRNRKRWNSLWNELLSSETIPKGSTLQANGSGSSRDLLKNEL